MIESLKNLWRLLSSRDRRTVAVLVAMMAIAALLEVVGVGAIPAFVSAVAYPDGLRQDPTARALYGTLGPIDHADLLLWGVIALIGFFAFKNAFMAANLHFQMRFMASKRAQLADRLVNAYMHAPYTFHLNHNTAELTRNVERETGIIAEQVLAALLEICTRAIILLAVLVFLFVVEPWITLGWVVVFGSLGAYGVGAIGARLKRYGQDEQRHRTRVLQSLNQGFGAIKESRILNREAFFAATVGDSIRSMAEATRIRRFTGAAMAPLTEFLAVAGLFLIAAFLILSGRPTESILVTLALFVVGLVRLRETVSAGMTHWANLRYSIVAVNPVYEDLSALEGGARRSQRASAADRTSSFSDWRELQLTNVWFRYENADRPALRGVSLTIPAGAAVGFIGGTGAGKSTLVDSILGLLEPQDGAITVDGKTIHSTDLGAWQTQIGYVPQSIYLLDDTIRRNIALGLRDADIDEEMVRSVLRAAQLENFVERLPDGVDTVIGERGARLSGGERQRIGIARALYHQPQLLVLDEATSALDNTTERAVIEAVEAQKGRRTIIMIAHRLSTVKNCDMLYFLKEGQIEASGDYLALQSRSLNFRTMTQAEEGAP